MVPTIKFQQLKVTQNHVSSWYIFEQENDATWDEQYITSFQFPNLTHVFR